MQTALGFNKLCNKSNTLKNLRRYEVTNSREFLRHLEAYESRRRIQTATPEITKRTEPNAG